MYYVFCKDVAFNDKFYDFSAWLQYAFMIYIQ